MEKLNYNVVSRIKVILVKLFLVMFAAATVSNSAFSQGFPPANALQLKVNGVLPNPVYPYVNMSTGSTCVPDPGNKSTTCTFSGGAGTVTSITCGTNMSCTPTNPFTTAGTVNWSGQNGWQPTGNFGLTYPATSTNTSGFTFALSTQPGGVGVGGNSGTGGDASWATGNGGDGSLAGSGSAGGRGGNLTLSCGAGGAGANGSGAGPGGVGGAFSVTAGTGGLGAVTKLAGAGGAITLTSGQAGAANGGTAASSGNIAIDVGASVSSGAVGSISIAPSNATTINCGNISSTTTIAGATRFNPAATTLIPITVTGGAGQNGYVYTGTTPGSVAGNGTAAGSAFNVTGATGGATSGSTGQTGGTGEGFSFTCGAGGTAPAGSANGTGGSFLVTVGAPGLGLGTSGVTGAATFQAPVSPSPFGTVLQVKNGGGAANFTVTDTGIVNQSSAANLAATTTPYLSLDNTTAATNGARVQNGPFFESIAQVWRTFDSTSQQVSWKWGARAVTGMAAGTEMPFFFYLPQAGTYTEVGKFTQSGLSTGTVTATTSIALVTTLLYDAAPTIASGFGTGASVTLNNGTGAFRIGVGTTSATTGQIGLPTATNGWNCTCSDLTTTSATVFLCKQTASNASSATIGNFSTGAIATAWPDNNVLAVSCTAL